MIEGHEGTVKLVNSFKRSYKWLRSIGEIDLKTAEGTPFTARAEIAKKGIHSGDQVIRFFQHGKEYARSYECCWGRYYNCNRTRIGMYCKALDLVVQNNLRKSILKRKPAWTGMWQKSPLTPLLSHQATIITGGTNMKELRRFFITSVTFGLYLLFFLPVLAQEKLPEIVKKIEPSTVVIHIHDKEGKIIGQGSGFFINKNGDIITNRHVLTGAHHA